MHKLWDSRLPSKWTTPGIFRFGQESLCVLSRCASDQVPQKGAKRIWTRKGDGLFSHRTAFACVSGAETGKEPDQRTAMTITAERHDSRVTIHMAASLDGFIAR